MPNSSVLLHRINSSTHPHITSTSGDPSPPFHHHNRRLSPAAPISDIHIPDAVAVHHTHFPAPHQSSSIVIHHVAAPIAAVWSIVRRFDLPQSYKHFVKTCELLAGDGATVGSLRRVHVISGLPAATSTERLEILDDDRRVISFSVVGGDHRLTNYRSVTTLHSAGEAETVVVESYVVDTPAGNTKDETCVFVDTIVRCNLQSLAQIADNVARRESSDQISRR